MDGLIYMDGNTLRMFYPNWVEAKEIIKSGSLLWNPFQNMGQPFLADPQSEALYPLQWSGFIFGFLNHVRLLILFHTALMAVFSFLLLRKRFDLMPAVLGALFTGFNGMVLARSALHSHFAAMAWAPAVLYFFSMRQPLRLGFALTFQWFAGFPPFFIVTGVALIIWGLADICEGLPNRQRTTRDVFFCLIIGGLTALGLAAVQVFPFLEMLRESDRGLMLAKEMAISYAIHPWDVWRQFFLPSFFHWRNQSAPLTDWSITDFYVGPFFLLLLLLGLRKPKKRQIIFAAGALLAVILSVGPYNGFYLKIPFITIFRFPANWMFLFGLCSIELMAKGLATLRSSRLKFGLFFLVALDLLAISWWSRSRWVDEAYFTQHPRVVEGFVAPRPGERILHTLPLWKAVVGSSVQSWDFLQAIQFPSIAAGSGLFEARSFNVLSSRRTNAFLLLLENEQFDSPLYDLARIRTIIDLKKSSDATKMPNWGDVDTIINKDIFTRAFAYPQGQVAINSDRPGDVIVDAIGPGNVVLSEAFAPGWKVTVDGSPRQIKLLKNLFLAIEIPEGEHRIHFFYHPWPFELGLLISAATLILVLGAALQKRIRTRRLSPYS